MLRLIKSACLIILLWVGILPARPSLAFPQTPAAPQDHSFEEGIRLLGERRFPEALSIFNRFKQTSPQDSRVYFYSGIALSESGRLSAAALEFEEAVRLNPENSHYRIYQANVLARLNQKENGAKVLEPFRDESALRPLPSAWLKLLVDTYFRLERMDDALRVLNILEKKTPLDPDINLNRGQVYVALGRSEEALGYFQKTLAVSNRNSIAHFEVGRILYERNRVQEGKKSLEEAVRQDPNNPKYLQKLGDACLRLGEVDRALEYLKRGEPFAGSFPRLYYSLGRAYQRMGERAKSASYMKKFQEITVAEREAKRLDLSFRNVIEEGEARFKEGDLREAQALFEKAAGLDPERWGPHGYLAEIFLGQGDLDRAHGHLIQMEKIDPESVAGNYLTARYWYERKEFGRARDYAEKVKRSRPGNSELRGLLGYIYLGLGDTVKARQEFEAALRLAPERNDLREQLEKINNSKNAVTTRTP